VLRSYRDKIVFVRAPLHQQQPIILEDRAFRLEM
jgi:hypothetical protein